MEKKYLLAIEKKVKEQHPAPILCMNGKGIH